MSLGAIVRAALEPWVGPVVADTCVRASALSLGKTADDLCEEDIPALVERVRQLLAPVAPTAAIEEIVSEIERVRALGG